jgi:hypothetical protein
MQAMVWLGTELTHGPFGKGMDNGEQTLRERLDDNEHHVRIIRSNWGFVKDKVSFLKHEFRFPRK